MDQAREKLGETTISAPDGSQDIEPIPESQEEINKQADGAIRDLFPRIPNTDRQMIIEHAFKKVHPNGSAPLTVLNNIGCIIPWRTYCRSTTYHSLISSSSACRSRSHQTYAYAI